MLETFPGEPGHASRLQVLPYEPTQAGKLPEPTGLHAARIKILTVPDPQHLVRPNI